VHVHDTYAVDHVAGAWMALAQYVDHGVLYPRLFDGSAFGGTRYMPFQFVTTAGVARITGEYLVAGKLVTYASALFLLFVLFVLCRRLSRSTLLALGLTGALLSTRAVVGDASTIQGDVLPVALQLSALYLATGPRGEPSDRSTVTAAALCALAFFCKLTAVWAPIAIAFWLVRRSRRRLAIFTASFLGFVVLLFAIFEVASDGRMLDNLTALTLGGERLGPVQSMTKFVTLGQQSATALWILAPFSVAAFAMGVARRRLDPFLLSLPVAVAILFAALRDIGADANHFIDVEALTAVVIADGIGMVGTAARRLVLPLALTAVLWAMATSYAVGPRHDTATAVRIAIGHERGPGARPLPTTVTAADRILSEDPYVDVSRGRRPVVLDPFMLLRIEEKHPRWQAELIRRIDRRAFTKVVTEYPLDSSRWWRFHHFGAPVVAAILRSYRLVPVNDGASSFGTYLVYEPR
jgi:hypothetical protein